jgi:hypothetical protein
VLIDVDPSAVIGQWGVSDKIRRVLGRHSMEHVKLHLYRLAFLFTTYYGEGRTFVGRVNLGQIVLKVFMNAVAIGNVGK